MHFFNTEKFRINLICSLIFICSLRVFSSIFLPFIDPSEARYAEIVRKLLETKDWITLYHDYGIPFWAKPPLSTWFSSIGMIVFGNNEFGARIPILATSLILIYLVMIIARTEIRECFDKLSALILFSTAGFYFLSAAVMTDMIFCFCITLSMVSFWLSHINNQKIWKYLFFMGIGLGMLAKGLIALVFIFSSVFGWILLQNNKWEILKKIPWVTGFFLSALISAPWYILAEIKTPGFLNYFIIGEHFNRFFISDWSGDLYGNAHSEMIGTIWLFFFQISLPWSLWFVFLIAKNLKKLKNIINENKFLSYILIWLLTPLLFFTFSKNIIPSYPLPSLPAFSLLLGYFITDFLKQNKMKKYYILFYSSIFIIPIFFATVSFFSYLAPNHFDRTQKYIIEAAQKKDPNSPIIYLNSVDYSAKFYTQGKAINGSELKINEYLEQHQKLFIISNEEQYQKFRNMFRMLTKVGNNLLLEKIKKDS